MTAPIDPLKTIRIASPCPAKWELMRGDDRVRFCNLCSLNVYNFETMTAAAARALIIRTEGRLCVRLRRRADGTIITRDCPTGLRALRRRMSRFASAAIAFIMSISFVACISTRERLSRRSEIGFQVERSETGSAASITGVVMHRGAPLPGVMIAVTSGEIPTRVAVTNEHGWFAIQGLSSGTYDVSAELEGMFPAIVKGVKLREGDVSRMKATLELSYVTEAITVGAAGPSALEQQSISTTLDGELIDRLPI